ncbi:MAG: DUF3473 domain-containing protein [Rhodospirillales bacterium]|nr:DUF3473 domain-containing protein [Rhodospirillales bacterium]
MSASPEQAPRGNAPLVNAPLVNAMSVDVEDYFQVQAFAGCIDRADWDGFAPRVADNTHRILDQFARHGVKATFFTLGWVAERQGALIRAIVAGGHELASHGYEHIRADAQDPPSFRADIARARAILEDTGGVAVRGYRAATFSIGARNLWAFAELEATGHAYSSSINPIRHDLYGMPDAPRAPFRPDGTALWELPMTTVRLGGRNLPCAGGGFFRLLPYRLFRAGLRRMHRADGMRAMFYFHPWEVDPGQPRIAGCGAKARFRHYTGLAAMAPRLDRLLDDFAWDRIDRVFSDLPGIGPGARDAARNGAG